MKAEREGVVDTSPTVCSAKPRKRNHGQYEATAPKHHWSNWYAAYMVARQQGKTPEDAAQDAERHMESIRG